MNTSDPSHSSAPSPSQRIRGFARRLFSSGEDIVDADEDQAQGCVDDQVIGSVKPRERVQISGDVTAVRSGTGSALGFQADLSDGTGHLVCIWMGRTTVPAVTRGTRMRVWGRTTTSGSNLVIYNPVYAIQASQDEV